MAKTKQTAKKSTGAPAPRVALGNLRPSSRMNNTPVKTTLLRNARTTDKSVGGGDNVGRSKGNNFCSGCRNGGIMTMCNRCPRAFCSECVIVSDTDTADDFHCPSCHLHSGKNGRRARKPSPYPHTVVGGAKQRELFPLCDESPLVIVSIRLSSIDPIGLPPTVSHQILHAYLPGSVELYDMPFNFSSTKGRKDYDALVNRLVDDLTIGRLSEYCRFSIFVTDHTDTDRGDMHFATDNQGATRVKSLMNTLLPEKFRNLIKSRDSGANTLTFLACGALVMKEESRDDIAEISKSGLFSWVMGFSQKSFQPAVSSFFIADTALKWFIQKRGPTAAIGDHQVLGAHSSVHLYYPDGTATKLVWSHPSLRPFGEPSPYQCPNKQCQSLKAWGKPKPKVKDGKIVKYSLKCRFCMFRVRFRKPKDMFLLRNTPSERGEWYTQPLSMG